jgi:hypothetical protein
MPVRTIAESDIAAATVLIGQLGYEMPQHEFTRRLTAVLAQADHHVWVYEDGGRVVGLLHAFFRPALDKPPEVMVQAASAPLPKFVIHCRNSEYELRKLKGH